MNHSSSGSFDFIEDALEDLEASGRKYLLIFTHGDEYVVNGNLSTEHANNIKSITRSQSFPILLKELTEES